jgi:guanylate kinase
MAEGKCIIFSAPSGAGKTTIVRHLLNGSFNLSFSVSACSRAQREGEVDGKDYYFLSVDEFKRRIEQNAFIEWEEVYRDHYYGTLKSEIERIWTEGKHVIFDVDVIGGLNLKRKFGDSALAIFVMPPNLQVLQERLQSRKTESDERIALRMAKAEKEMQTAPQFDIVLNNTDLEAALKEAERVVQSFISTPHA